MASTPQDQAIADCWRRYDAIEARLTAPVSERMLDLAQLQPGMRLLDVAAGRGEPALRAAHRVGPEGFVLGIDRNDGVLEIARELARSQRLTNIVFRVSEAEAFELGEEARFDVATCRWGLMYFQSPQRALERIRRALEPGGVLVAALWAERDRVPYATLMRTVQARYQPVEPRVPEAPGVFRYSELEVIRREWSAAGFRIEHVEELDIPVIETDDGAGIVAWYRALAGTSWPSLPEKEQRAFEDALAREAERYRVGEKILLGGVTRLVVART